MVALLLSIFIPHMCRLQLGVPTPNPRNDHFFIMQLYKIGRKPKFRQCYILGNVKSINIYVLGYILVPVSEGSGGISCSTKIFMCALCLPYVHNWIQQCHAQSISSE